MENAIGKEVIDHNQITYEIFVQSFADSNGDGIGDIPGMTSKLDYLSDLGIEAIWLMPINESPSYHKYDVIDYKSIHPDYGTMDDFKEFLHQAHSRNIKVIIDFIINHTSSQNPWFMESQKGPDNPYRDYYVWRNEEDVKSEIAKRETSHDSDNITQWHKANGNEQLYYGFFWGGMPDLNYDNPKVFEEIVEIGRFWLEDIGVDGLRMDAAKHIFPDHRAEDNHRFWRKFRSAMEAIKPDVYIVGEVWSDAKTIAPFAQGLSSLFNFDLAFSILQTLNNGTISSASIEGNTHKIQRDSSFISVLKENLNLFSNRNSKFLDGVFLSNHDQNRVASVLKNGKGKIKQAAAILLSLPGRPYIYYGEELGMRGAKPDEFIREPMLWGLNGDSISNTSWIEAKYNKTDSFKTAYEQINNSKSIFSVYKELIKIRKGTSALKYGDIDEVDFGDNRILGYLRYTGDEEVLVLHNISDTKIELELLEDFTEFNKVLYQRVAQLSKHGVITLSRNGSIFLTKEKQL